MADKNIKNIKNIEGYDEVEPKIFKFINPGDKIEGILSSIEDSSSYKTKVYKIQNQEGFYTVFGSAVLDSLINNNMINNQIIIMFDGIKKNPKIGQNDIKLFRVFLKKR